MAAEGLTDIDGLPADWPERYLRRIGAMRPERADLAALAELLRRHLLTVPFENLDIVSGRPIAIGTRRAIEKIAFANRGGFCFEMNEAFRALLTALGYSVQRIEGRVWAEPAQAFGTPFDHLALVVDLPDGAFLVDVGFGDGNRAPLQLPDGETEDISGRYRLRRIDGGGGLVLERLREDHARPLYELTLSPRALGEFETMCAYHQSSPASIFTKGPICTLATVEGRISLAGDRFIETTGNGRQETVVFDAAARADILKSRFGIVSPA